MDTTEPLDIEAAESFAAAIGHMGPLEAQAARHIRVLIAEVRWQRKEERRKLASQDPTA